MFYYDVSTIEVANLVRKLIMVSTVRRGSEGHGSSLFEHTVVAFIWSD